MIYQKQFENKFNCNVDSPNIEYIEKIDSLYLAKLINSCSVGLLINNKSEHAERFTSPLKYFEYIVAALKYYLPIPLHTMNYLFKKIFTILI